MNPKTHVRLEEALALLQKDIPSMENPIERVATENSVGRILAEDLEALRNLPHFVASAVDGFALQSKMSQNAGPGHPALLSPDQAAWINTGGELPTWADAVAMVEDTSSETDGTVRLFRTLPPGANVRPVGEDVMKGQIIGREGDRVTPALCALCVAAGLYEIPVRRKPRTLFIPTGNEVVAARTVPPETDVPAQKVLESNSIFLGGLFRQWDFQLDIHPIIPDDPEKLSTAVQAAVENYDLVLIGAGSAKGRRDFTAQVLDKLGNLVFRWVLVRPGRPAMAASIGNKPVLCLPGFPTSTAVTAWGLVFPLLKLLEKGSPYDLDYLPESVGAIDQLQAEFLVPHSSPPGVSEWLRVQAAEIDGKKYIWSLSIGSSSMSAMSDCDGLVLLDEETLECPKGTPCNMLLTRKVDYSKRILFQGSNDPAFERITSFIRMRGNDIVLRSVGSLGGISALSRGEGHVAACHLLDGKTGTYNDSFISRFQGPEPWERILLFWREQGIMVPSGNPKKLRSIQDLASKDVSIVNRQPGAGTRVLLDYLLSQEKLSPSDLWGYENISLTHLDAANKIACGQADAALGIRAASKAMGLDFIPLVEEPYELVIPQKHRHHPGIEALLEALEDSNWKKQVDRLGGYRWPN